MAYVAYEDIRPVQAGYRIIPRLRKYYRADDTFDLFDITKRQMCCFRYLASKSEFGLFFGRADSNVSFGTISLSGSPFIAYTNKSTLTSLVLTGVSQIEHSAIVGYDLILKIDNSAGYFPCYVRGIKNSAAGRDHPSFGYGYMSIYDNSIGSLKCIAGSTNPDDNVNRDLSYNVDFNSPSTLWDYRDYDYIKLHGYGYDTSKYAYAAAQVVVYGIHKFSVEHPLYRYYR